MFHIWLFYLNEELDSLKANDLLDLVERDIESRFLLHYS